MRDIVKAKKIIENRRDTAKKEFEKRRETLLSDPDFAENYRRISCLRFELAKRDVFGINADDIREEYEELKTKIDEKLAKCGVSSVDEPDYYCKECSDTGYVGNKRCGCLEKVRTEVNLTDNPCLKEVPDGLKNINFAFYGEKRTDYEKYAKFLNNNFVKGNLNFCTLIGASGTGKTFLAETCLKTMLFEGNYVSVLNGIKLNRIFLEYHCAALENKADIWRELTEPDVLLIDDLGVESVLNNVTIQYLYELITERTDLKTVITSNLDLRGFENKYGQRILSRLADKRKSAIICFSGEDYRIN